MGLIAPIGSLMPAKLAVENLIGPLECERQGGLSTFQVLPPLPKRLLWAVDQMDM